MKIHINNRQRLIRFINKQNVDKVEPRPLYKHIIIGLTTPRENLYRIINNRVDDMIKKGLIAEVKKFYDQDIKTKPLLSSIGYKELYKYFNKELTLEEAIELIKKNSRHYAKRQYTFFNNQLDVNWFDVNYENFNETIEKVVKFIEVNYDIKSK